MPSRYRIIFSAIASYHTLHILAPGSRNDFHQLTGNTLIFTTKHSLHTTVSNPAFSVCHVLYTLSGTFTSVQIDRPHFRFGRAACTIEYNLIRYSPTGAPADMILFYSECTKINGPALSITKTYLLKSIAINT